MSSEEVSTNVSRRKRAGALAGVLGIAAAIVAVVLSTAAGGGTGGYHVRAIFKYAANISGGEQIKIAGVPVGSVEELTITRHGRAAVVMDISNTGFQDFRSDATCSIRPESLLGEKYVECVPTQPREPNAPLPPPLKRIPKGQEGEGERLVALSHTSSPVEADQLQDITRMPEAQKLRIILNELGIGFAARGPELRQAIVSANPALQELDKVVGIFAKQNRLLANLAEESDRALAPFARARHEVAHFIDNSNTVARASARNLAPLEEDFAKLPRFLEKLGPAMERIGRFAEQTTPTFANLGVAAPAVDEVFENLGPFSKSTNTYMTSLGKTAKRTGPALKAIEPLLDQLSSLGKSTKPFAGNLATTLSSFEKTGGIERLMDFLFLGAGATNGYDSLGHFLRAEVIADPCVGYEIAPPGGCSANFVEEEEEASASSASTKPSTQSATIARTLAVLEGATPAEAIAAFPSDERGAPTSAEGAAQSKPVGGNAGGTTYYSPGAESPRASERLLEYLLGS